MIGETIRERIANVGAGVTPTYHATESVEEAIAVVGQCMSATERDQVSYEEGYADGFDRGEEAIIQQIEGIIDDPMELSAEDTVERIYDLCEQFWKERES